MIKKIIQIALYMLAIYVVYLICTNTDSFLSAFTNLAVGIPVIMACTTTQWIDEIRDLL